MDKQELKNIWDENKEVFLSFLSKEQQKPLTHSQLSKAFVDLKGRQYYRFSEGSAKPLQRLGKMKEYMMWMSNGLTNSELQMLITEMEKTILDGLSKSQNVTRLGAIIEEIKKRFSLVIHTELLYNFVAVQLVREDESPEVFDNDIQKEKVIAFKEMTRDGSTYFFFQSAELKAISSLLSMSQQEWDQYWQESQIKQQSLPLALRAFVSTIISENQKMISTNN